MRKKWFCYLLAGALLLESLGAPAVAFSATPEASRDFVITAAAAKKKTKKKTTKKKTTKKKTTDKKSSDKKSADKKTTKKDSSYLLAKSNSKYLTWDDVKKLDVSEYRFARNEIYARHGYIFKAADLKKFFEGKSWYKGTVKSSDFDSSVFNEYEHANVKYLKSLEPAAALSGAKTAGPKDTIDGYGYENGYSTLAFSLKEGTATDKGKYYVVDATYYQAITVPGNLKVGDKVTVEFNGLTGEKKTLVRKKDGLYPTDDPDCQFYYTPTKDGSRVVLYEGSDDRVEKPVLEGELWIRKDSTQEVAVIDESKTFDPKKIDEGSYYNGVYFDEKGYVVRLVYYGD